MKIKVMANTLDNNEYWAAVVRSYLASRGVFAVTLWGGPGSGKTSLLERTIAVLKKEMRLAVITGDLFTGRDGQYIERQGVPVVQINTAGGGILDAAMINSALRELDLQALDLLLIENVGNLVCSVQSNLGEDAKVVVLSVAEGDDKPLKYPVIFGQAAAVIINKLDLLPYCRFSLAAVTDELIDINLQLVIFKTSCYSGQGLENWYAWLRDQVKKKQENDREIDNLNVKQQEIEQARELLHKMVKIKQGDLANQEVARLSARLDRLIVDYERARRKQGLSLINK